MALKFANNNSLSAITSLPASISGGAWTLISTTTASSSSSLSITSGIDSTYKEYIFKLINIHPATDNAELTFNLSADSGSNYNVTKTTAVHIHQHGEDDSNANSEYSVERDLAQSTGYQKISKDLGNGNDESASGYLHLFDPSNTTFVKNFMTRTSSYFGSDRAVDMYVGGYGNTTSAVNGIDFKMSSGNIDSGVIKLYGVS
tara:strand:+ start:206 stop:811 length:606 start_codon:yes stop_codon:yes gene_type:complete